MRGVLFRLSNRLMSGLSVLSCFSVLVCIFSAFAGNAYVDNQPIDRTSFQGNSFSVYILSRGKGVPEEARTAFNQVYQELVELKGHGKLSYLKKEMIGLEGERRICAEFRDSENARAMFTKIKKLAVEIDLFDVVPESCVK